MEATFQSEAPSTCPWYVAAAMGIHFALGATAAFFGNAIYAINARFRMDGSSPPERDDDIVRVPR